MACMPARRRWADMRDSSNETWSDSRSRNELQHQHQLPRSDTRDSYQQSPLQDLDENSSASLNGRMQRSVNVSRSSPCDFAFLLPTASSSKPAAAEDSNVEENDDSMEAMTTTRNTTTTTTTSTWNRGDDGLEGNLRDSELPRRALNCHDASDSSNRLGIGSSGARAQPDQDPGFSDGMDVEIRDTSPPARNSGSLAPLAVFGEACGKVAGGPRDFSFLFQTGPRKQGVSVCDMMDSGPEDNNLSLSGYGEGPGQAPDNFPGSEPASTLQGQRKGHRRRANRKRRQTGDDDACRAKRNREGEVDQPQVIVTATATGLRASSCMEPLTQEQKQQHLLQAKKSQAEDADTVAHRLEKRRTLIEILKRSPEYVAFQAGRREGGRSGQSQCLETSAAAAAAPDAATNTATAAAVPAPRTPDPSDASISKKKWEEDVRLWKLALRSQVDHGSQSQSQNQTFAPRSRSDSQSQSQSQCQNQKVPSDGKVQSIFEGTLPVPGSDGPAMVSDRPAG
mmetsp:Transcript_80843/g.168700  ORF Transcript_80843/g.168700 Transcript_80843/m.168700 type:complete len:508 (+) Transcript_80843:650-2173(+)|eukprot:CAMPEP_0206433618 /NCGR_PEP_ID=MMETSP0324_2-20121206/8637_1 /ASSEMBLY_ACC=CAM_ASM_000836 /TAXON_ID=2866 /ORGANISM="Crypthecodinium cohnii, Strain Seligo" /LENGTH=507 /DNA_ID=CAMNT_0053899911 /DNA_START=592 /DNA_END=2115 /DNA_ORIENTATION=-